MAHELDGASLIVDYKSDRVRGVDLEELTERPNSALDPRVYFYSWPSARNRKHAACNATIRATLASLIARRQQERRDPALVGEEHRDMLKYMLDAHEEDDASVTDSETLVL